MNYRLAAIMLTALGAAAVSQIATAASLPAIKAGQGNAVPECATPGRLMAYLRSRNGGLDRRFDTVATEYMRHGESLGVRWDYAFFQMLVETGSLTFKRDVKPHQNNFAGLGATGGGEPGESFPDVATGVKAHLQHALIYAGERIESPVAERTRKVQEWGILTSWQKGFKRPITFTDMTRKWSPKDNGYSNDIESVAARFMSDFCNKPDPQPDLVREARNGTAAARTAAAEDKGPGAEIARKAIEQARKENPARAGLGAKAVVAAGAPAESPPVHPASEPALKILNPTAADGAQPAPAPPASSGAAAKPPAQTVAAAGNTARAAAPTPPAPPAAAASKCRVWTASYGGQRSVLIRQIADQTTNYTVLVVNEGTEKREVDAYISAYAKGGMPLGEFASQSQALDKAFDLCPED